MKKFICLLLLYMFPTVAHADCWQISDTDRRNFCLGISQKSDNYCWQINNNNKKNFCLAMVKKDTNYCWQIDDNDLRHECLSFVDM